MSFSGLLSESACGDRVTGVEGGIWLACEGMDLPGLQQLILSSNKTANENELFVLEIKRDCHVEVSRENAAGS
ncbi:hypothetical protein WJX77_004001 [Trebouxia sp. C0004]